MNSTVAKFAKKKVFVVSVLITAGLVMVTLPSCKHQKGGCDAYQGSQRSLKKNKHRSAQVESVRQNAFIA